MTPGSREWRHFIAALFLAGFATFVLIFSPQAFLSTLSAELNANAEMAAGTVSAAALGVAAGVLAWAALSDRTGRVRAMRWSLVTAVALAAITPMLPTIQLVLVARFVEGVLVGAAPAIGMAHIAERVIGAAAARAAGTFVAGNTIGGIVGRLISGAAAGIGGWRLAFAGSTIIAAVAVAAFLYLTRRPATVRPPAAARGTRPGIATNLRDPLMLLLYLQGFLLMGAFGVIYNFLGYRLQESPVELPAALTSSVFIVYLAGTLAASRSGAVAARISETGALVGGAIAMIASLPLMAQAFLPLTIIGLVLFTIGCFTAHPLASGLTGRCAISGRSQATALYQIAWLGGTSIFGFVGGVVYTASGWGAALWLVAGMCALSGLLAALNAPRLSRRQNASQPSGGSIVTAHTTSPPAMGLAHRPPHR